LLLLLYLGWRIRGLFHWDTSSKGWFRGMKDPSVFPGDFLFSTKDAEELRRLDQLIS